MLTFPLTRPVNVPQLAAELGRALHLSEPPAITVRQTGQFDEAGEVLPGLLRLDDQANASPSVIEAVLSDHVPEVSTQDRREALAVKAEAGTLTTAERDEALSLLLAPSAT